jgi:hypothetical protein
MIPPDKYNNGIMLTDIISKQPQFVNITTMFLVWKTFVFTNNTKASPGKQSVEAQCVVQWVLAQGTDRSRFSSPMRKDNLK